jgi:hypothetical protein
MQKLANLQAIKSTNEVKIIDRQINDLEGIFVVFVFLIFNLFLIFKNYVRK